MTTRLKKKRNEYYCGHCRMKQPNLRASCIFCGRIFYNYEELLAADFIEANYDIIDDDVLRQEKQ